MATGESAATIADDSDARKSKDFPSFRRLRDLMKDLSCPVCFQRLRDPFLTPCGHSFCYSCITMHLYERNSCPCCSSYLTTQLLYPNVLLGKVVRELQTLESMNRDSLAEHIQVTLQHGGQDLSLKEVDALLKLLEEMKVKAQSVEAEENMDSLLEFFHELRRRKWLQLQTIKEDMNRLKDDLTLLRREREELRRQRESYIRKFAGTEKSVTMSAGSGVCHTSGKVLPQLKSRIRKAWKASVLIENHDQFRQCYIDETRRCPPGKSNFGLTTLRSVMSGFSRYGKLHVLSETQCSGAQPNITSGLDFDPDDEFFAAAGVSGYLRVFEYPKVVRWSLAMWNPCVEIQTGTKLSSVSWDKFAKSCLATGDYDGIIKIWDVNACQTTVLYDEHERRIWSVEFSPTEPLRLVSGGDDGKVKLWSKEQKASVYTIEVKANICSVSFNPGSNNLIAAGAADHCIYYYDLRQTKSPLLHFKGHEKAVSYVKFMSANEMVSASTDGTLRLWGLEEASTALQVFQGHRNEKNFVGLSVTSEYIACGSETNEIYVYHKGIPKPAISHLFTNTDVDADPPPFVSAICWKRSESTTLLAASSQGNIRALMLSS